MNKETIISKRLFGSNIDFILEDNNFIKDISDEAYAEGIRLEKIFNFYDPRSELSILNKKRKLKVSDELLEVIKLGLKYSELTDGEYDIGLGKSIQARKAGKDLKINSSYKDIKIKDNVIELSSDALIDLGSVAKGYIVDKMAGILISQGVLSGLINGRGDIRMFGEEQVLGIQHPREKDKIIKKVMLKDCAIATSGDYNQYTGSFENTHIINNKDLISVSVIAPTLMIADMFATILFVCEKDLREKLLKNHKELAVMTIDKHLKEEYYNNFGKFLVE